MCRVTCRLAPQRADSSSKDTSISILPEVRHGSQELCRALHICHCQRSTLCKVSCLTNRCSMGTPVSCERSSLSLRLWGSG